MLEVVVADLVAGITFSGVTDALYDVALVIAGVLIVKRGISWVLGMVGGGR